MPNGNEIENLRKLIQAQALRSVALPAQKPEQLRQAEFSPVDIFESIKTGAKAQPSPTKRVLGGVVGGISGVLQYLNTPEGKRYMAGLSGSPGFAAGMLGQAEADEKRKQALQDMYAKQEQERLASMQKMALEGTGAFGRGFGLMSKEEVDKIISEAGYDPNVVTISGFDQQGNPMLRVKTPEEQKIGQAVKKEIAVGRAKSLVKQEQERAKSKVNFAQNINLLNRTRETFKKVLEETKGGGLPMGMVGKTGAFLKAKGFSGTAAYPGQRRESAVALNRIITNQNRPIRDVIKMIQSTLPEIGDTKEFYNAKMEQSVRNAYGLYKGMQQAGIDLETVTDDDVKKYIKDTANVENVEEASNKFTGFLDESDEPIIQEILKYVLIEDEPTESKFEILEVR